MRTIAFSFFLFVSLSALALPSVEEIHKNPQWQRLLKISDARPNIFSRGFYLTSQPASQGELKTHVDIFRSSAGVNLACQFPARYSWLKTQVNLPEIDLRKCEGLQAFIRSMPFSRIQLAFVSENIQSPASAFGHLMLVLRSSSLPMESWTVVHYAALVDGKDPLLGYIYKGLAGGYRGSYARTPFFKKYFEYILTEQRYIYFYDLDLSREEEQRLLYHLWELRDAHFRYFFKDENCAYQIAQLVQSSQNQSTEFSPGWAVFPTDVVRTFSAGKAPTDSLQPLSRQVEMEYASLSANEKDIFGKIVEGKFSEEPDSSAAMGVASKYATYQFRAKGEPLSEHRKIQSQVFMENFDFQWSRENHSHQQIQPTLIALGLQSESQRKLLIGEIRPLLNAIEDPKYSDARESELKLLDTKFAFDTSSGDFYILDLDLLSLKYFPFRRSPFSPISWAFSSRLNRDWKRTDLSWDNELLLGVSYNIFPKSFAGILMGGGHSAGGAETPFYFSTKSWFSTYIRSTLKFSLYYTKKYSDHWICQSGANITSIYQHFYIKGELAGFGCGNSPLSTSLFLGVHF